MLLSFDAVVWSGRRMASSWMAQDNFLSEALRAPLVSGSINLYIGGRHVLFGQNVHPTACRNAGLVRACPCTVGTCDAFILNVDPDNGRNPIAQPNTMFEIVASVHLRDTLGLVDLARVCLRFDPDHAKDYRP